MAVLNKIRQRSLFLIIIIALALFAFVLDGVIRNLGSPSSSQNVVATVNGKDIKRDEFMQKVETMQRQAGPGATNSQVINQVWEQEVRQAVMESQFEKLGITIEKDQMRNALKAALGSSPEFLNEVGMFDENKLNEFIANLKEIAPKATMLGGQQIDYQSWLNYEKSLTANALQQNYLNMVKAGLTATLKEGELEHKLEGNKIDIQFVQIPYASIDDSKVKIEKSEISDYIKKHKKQFEVDASRNIKFVQFDEVASETDEKAINESLKALLKDRIEYNDITKANENVIGFLNTTNTESFVNANSDIKFDNRFVFKSSLSPAVADSIFKLSEGKIYGPYKENGFYKVSKVVASKQIPDSTKSRHILIPFKGSQSASPDVTKTEEQAEAFADSLLAVLKTDKSKFSEFVTKYSSDQGSVSNEGRYDWHPYNTMVPEFNDFEFEGNVGDLGVVKTIFGFHIMEIEGQKQKNRAIQVATVARKVEPSEATVDKIFRDATNFEVSLEKSNFEAAAKSKKIVVRPVNNLKVLDEMIPGIGAQRPIVRWAFEAGTDVGDVKRFNIPNGYVIVQLVSKNKKGLMSVEDASATVTPILRKEKKAEMIRKGISAKTVEAVASSQKVGVQTATGITMKNPVILTTGNEPLVVGSAFGLKQGQTSKLIDGVSGVYMVKVTKVEPAVKLVNYQAAANRLEQQKLYVTGTKLYEALKKASDIEDNRADIQIQ